MAFKYFYITGFFTVVAAAQGVKERWISGNASRGVADRDVAWLPRTGSPSPRSIATDSTLFGRSEVWITTVSLCESKCNRPATL